MDDWPPLAHAYRIQRWTVGFVALATLGVTVISLLVTAPAIALPAGRAWVPMDTTKVPGHTRLYPNGLDLDSLGRPLLVAVSAGGIGYDVHALGWRDTTWSLLATLGYPTAYFYPAISTGTSFPLVWQTLDQIYRPGLLYPLTYLLMGRLETGSFVEPDTIAEVWAGGFAYAGAASPRRRWAVKHDYTNGLRLWYSDTLRSWHGLSLPGSGNYGVTAAPLGDTTALVVWTGSREGVRWGVLDGTAWADGGLIPGAIQSGLEGDPRLRISPDGSMVLGWSTDDAFVMLATYAAGQWTSAESLSCPKHLAGQYLSRAFALSRDSSERPVVAWIEHNVDRGFMGTLCVCVPSDSGYPRGEEVPGTDDAWNLATVRDANEDVWLVWQTEFDGMFWTHTHVTASAASPRFEGSTDRPRLSWTLSEPAPGSHWTVERATGTGAFEPVWRARAGPGTSMGWLDSNAPGGEVLRYRIRRECLDVRYQQVSAESAWWPRGPSLGLTLTGAQPSDGELELLVVGAETGALELRVFDLQGREVARERAYANGAGQDRLRLSLQRPGESLPSAVYFVRVTDRTGRRSATLKAVVVR